MARSRQYLQQFWQAEEGQDLIEYTLIVAAVALVCAGILITFTPTTRAVWQHNNILLSEAASASTT
jgi:Flp pilus assembly pilin Flp